MFLYQRKIRSNLKCPLIGNWFNNLGYIQIRNTTKSDNADLYLLTWKIIRFNLSGGKKQLQNSMINVTLFIKILVVMGTEKKPGRIFIVKMLTVLIIR